MNNYLSHEMQVALVAVVVAFIIAMTFYSIKKYGIKSKVSASMFGGFCVGLLFSYYYLSPLILAPLGMIIGIACGKRHKKIKS